MQSFKKTKLLEKLQEVNNTMKEYIYLDSKQYEYITIKAIDDVSKLITKTKNKYDLIEKIDDIKLSIKKEFDLFHNELRLAEYLNEELNNKEKKTFIFHLLQEILNVITFYF